MATRPPRTAWVLGRGPGHQAQELCSALERRGQVQKEEPVLPPAMNRMDRTVPSGEEGEEGEAQAQQPPAPRPEPLSDALAQAERHPGSPQVASARGQHPSWVLTEQDMESRRFENGGEDSSEARSDSNLKLGCGLLLNTPWHTPLWHSRTAGSVEEPRLCFYPSGGF